MLDKKYTFLLVFTILILGFQANAQIVYEQGYFIDNNGNKIQCLIKNREWSNNPSEFQYKLSENGKAKKKPLEYAQAFGIPGDMKYVRHQVNIDRSDEREGHMNSKRNPVFHKEVLFLQVLVEGEASLYSYRDGNLIRYFYKTSISNVKQLIHKKYKISQQQVGTNSRYKQQLLNHLKCQDINRPYIENLHYWKKALVKLFVTYNQCMGANFTNYKKNKSLLHFTIRPGLNMASLSLENKKAGLGHSNFENDLGFRFGIALEFILPFNKNKWTVLLEPSYQYFKSKGKFVTSNHTINLAADYKSIELSVGLRHYFFLNEHSQIFINASFLYDFSSNSKVELNEHILEVGTAGNLTMGVGYRYNSKFSTEIRYGFKRDILIKYPHWFSDYQNLQFILGYTLF